MTAKSLILGICAGLASAVVFASASTGPMPLRVVLFLLTPFPLYVSGLTLGMLPSLIGAAAGCAFIYAISNAIPLFTFAAGEAIPALILTRLALSMREKSGSLDWYPVGRILIASALLAGGLSFAYLAAQGADPDALVKLIRGPVEEFAKTQLPNLPGALPLDEAQIAELTNSIAAALPGAISISVMLTALGSLWLAGRVALAAGTLLRPWPNLSKIELPLGSALLFLIATVIGFLDDRAWLLANGFATALQFAFALLGLAVVHHVTTASPWRGFILTAVYAGLLILTKHLLLILSLIGLAETIFHYRYSANRPAPVPPHDND